MTGKITAVLLALLLITGIATKNIGFLEAKKDTGNGSVYYLNFKPEQDGEWQKLPDSVIEATMIDGCNPLQTFFKVVFPVLKPSMISVGILETMWIWNDYLLPTLVLDIKQYKTIPMLIQYFRGSYGRVEMGPMMACVVLTVLPVIIIYLVGQKHIVKGVLAGSVKG